MTAISAPEGASVVVLEDDFADGFMEQVKKTFAREAQKLVTKFLSEIDSSISEKGVNVWPLDPQGDLIDWYFTIDWEHLKEEAHVFCSNFANLNGTPYDEGELANIKRARDGFAELVAIFDGELFAGKPTPETVKHLG